MMLWCFSIFQYRCARSPCGTHFFSRQNSGVVKLIVNSHRWKQTALAAAALFALWEPNAMALSLGRVTVLSALGEPLRAEVDVPEINAEEAASLKAVIASPASFKAAGLDYSAAISSLQVSLHKRADGRTYIRLNGGAVNDPFVDLILEASWASGRIVRDYTLLFDPPNLRPAAPPALNPPQLSAPRLADRPAPTAVVPAAPRALEPQKLAPQPALRPAAAATPGSASGKINVKAGDTASRIASAIKPASVSLDQMLVALLRANPMAFLGDNVNRIKAGSVMTIPLTEQAEAIPAAQATQIIVAQSKDFNEFRRRLALGAPQATLTAADRTASGSVETKVEDQRKANLAQDKLTLSKGAIQKQQAEDQLAAQRASQEATKRAAELSQNISDLSKLGAASTTGAASAMAAPSAPAAASAPVVNRPVAVPAPVAKPSLVDDLLENPILPAGAGAVVALLAILGLYRARQRRQIAEDDNLTSDVRARPDSFFDASGGQSIDTSSAVSGDVSHISGNASTGSAVPFSSSQLGAAEVDPVAEADVYLAYGRDGQAEEILVEALQSNPGRLAIHQKLLELFAKRRDLQSFQTTAELAYTVSEGQGPDWERMRELGQSIDPGNALYRPGGQPNKIDETPTEPAQFEPVSAGSANADRPASQAPVAASAGAVDIDLDLDFSIDETSASAGVETSNSLADTEPAALDLDLNLASKGAKSTDADDNSIDFVLPDLPQPHDKTAAPNLQLTASKAPKFDMLEFDLNKLSLDLDDAPTPDSSPASDMTQDHPLAIKLELAEEFQAIGDSDGARALLEEVIAQASGDMKIKAQNALAKLSPA
jgi:pilus assembly protein FimV